MTTDFGLTDTYVAEMKAVLLRQIPRLMIVDGTHHIPPQDVQAGSLALQRLVKVFPPGTIHIAVVDPGVGSDRRILLVEVNRQYVICPDNGLITWAWRRHPQHPRPFELLWRPVNPSQTFHGRDIMAPAAALIAGGKVSLKRLARPIDSPILLDIAPAIAPVTHGRIIGFDHFGNAVSNVPDDALSLHMPGAIRVKRWSIPFHPTYASVAPGKPLALFGSSGLLEIAVRNGSAQRSLNLKLNDTFTLS